MNSLIRNTFEAKEVELGRLFNNDYLFTMPVYQRPYSWTTEETGELLSDLLSAMGDGESREPDPYFLGSIVLIARPNSIQHEVIDGQQRLTTLTMLFCVLRELSEDGDKSASLDRRVRENRDVFAGGRDRFRLTIRSRDQEFFQNSVQMPGKIADFIEREPVHSPDSRKLIFDNVKFLWTELSDLKEEQRDRLSEFIIRKCYLVVVSAYDRDSAHRIFSVLNARGLDLTPTDILKSDIIGDIRGNDQDRYTRLWEDVEDELGREGFRELFAHIYVIMTGNRFHRELAKAFKDDVLSSHAGSDFIDQYLIPYSESFKAVVNASYESSAYAQEVNRLLSYLGRIDNSDWIPPAMVFYHMHKTQPEILLELLKKLDRLTYVMFIIGVRRDPRILRYKPIIDAVKNGETALGHLEITTSEQKEAIDSLNGQVYRPRPVARFARPLLLRLDSMLADGSASYDHKTITVEHVLPQSPDSESSWDQDFPDEDARMDWMHRLANLVLLSRSKNSSSQNLGFDEKKRRYFLRNGVSDFALTTQIVSEPEWTPKVLERRQRELIDVFKTEWNLG